MSRFLGYSRKINRRLTRLEKKKGLGDVGMAMWRLAMYGEIPKNPATKAMIEQLQEMARAMAATVPRCPPPDPEPLEELSNIPLSETYEAGEPPQWV